MTELSVQELLDTERTFHAAWRKRAEEAEAALISMKGDVEGLREGLRRAIQTACNDDISEPGTEKRARHVQRIDAMEAAFEALATPAPQGERYRHKKRGSTYVVVAYAQVQTIEPIQEDDTIVVYRGEHDGTTWARPLHEFQDGRFEELTPAPQGERKFDFLAHLARQREWSGKTFGPGPRTAGVIDHIRKELREIEANPSDISEWIDVATLALDGAWRAGHSPEQIVTGLVAKQNKNEARKWPDWRTASPDKAIEHVRGRTEHSGVMKEIMGESYDELD